MRHTLLKIFNSSKQYNKIYINVNFILFVILKKQKEIQMKHVIQYFAV